MADTDVVQTLGSRQCVIFSLENEHYGVDIFQVREIIRVPPVTHIPGAPEYVQGVINLRGGVIPIIDLRKRFGMAAHAGDDDRRIVVVELGAQTVGMVVDGVSEVLEIDAAQIEPPSPFIVSVHSHAIQGIAKKSETLIILLDLEALLSGQEKEQLKQLASVGASQPGPAGDGGEAGE